MPTELQIRYWNFIKNYYARMGKNGSIPGAAREWRIMREKEGAVLSPYREYKPKSQRQQKTIRYRRRYTYRPHPYYRCRDAKTKWWAKREHCRQNEPGYILEM